MPTVNSFLRSVRYAILGDWYNTCEQLRADSLLSSLISAFLDDIILKHIKGNIFILTQPSIDWHFFLMVESGLISQVLRGDLYEDVYHDQVCCVVSYAITI